MANSISVADGDRLTMAFGASAGSVLGAALVVGAAVVAGAAVVVGAAVLEPQAASAMSSADAAAVRNNFKGTSSE